MQRSVLLVIVLDKRYVAVLRGERHGRLVAVVFDGGTVVVVVTVVVGGFDAIARRGFL